MGVELNIVRKNNWNDYSEPSNITLEEWIQYAESDTELKKEMNEEAGSYVWEGYLEDKSFGTPWFNYSKGYIFTKNPNILVIQKLIVIATALNAKVYDEEGDPFDPSFLGL